jgi:hypothetical protein
VVPLSVYIDSEKVTPKNLFAVGEVALSHEEPLSVDLTMFPPLPTALKVLFPNPTHKIL